MYGGHCPPIKCVLYFFIGSGVAPHHHPQKFLKVLDPCGGNIIDLSQIKLRILMGNQIAETDRLNHPFRQITGDDTIVGKEIKKIVGACG